MTITWYGHSCFKLTGDRGSVVIDPYAPGSVPGLDDISAEAEAVLCSHSHKDHGYTDGVALTGGESGFRISEMKTYHDEAKGLLRGRNTIHILGCGDLKIVHMGDIGCKLTQKQLTELAGADCLMIPVGGHYTIDAETAKQMADDIGANVVMPMHYRGDGFGYPVLSPLDDYLALCGDAVFCSGSEFELKKGMKKQTAILRPLKAK